MQRILLLHCLALFGMGLVAPAQAGLFVDEDMHKHVQQLEARVVVLESAANQETKSMLDLQGQLEELNAEIRKLHGQNEEIVHDLQDSEKRAKDFYVDLDTRLRHFESAEHTLPASAAAATTSSDPNDPVSEDRAFENAYALFKSGSYANATKAFQEFIKKYPKSVQVPNANYWLGNAQFALKGYKSALLTYQEMLKDFPNTPRVADVLLNIAGCQLVLKQPVEAKKTLKHVIAKYPSSDAAAKAKKLLAKK